MLLAVLMVMTMSFSVFAEEEPATLTITNIFSNRSNIYVDLSETVVDNDMLSATLTQLGDDTPILNVVTTKNEAAEASSVVIALEEKLDLNKTYKLVLTTSAGTVTKIFKFVILAEENFDSASTDVLAKTSSDCWEMIHIVK